MKHIFNLLLVVFLCTTASYSQLKGLGNLGKALKKNKAVNQLMEGTPAISTSFNDVVTEGSLPPTFGEGETFKPLSSLKKNANGNYILEPGFYEATKLSYCLKVGTPGPAKGNVYGLAPLEGKMDDIVLAILQKSHNMWVGGGADSENGVSRLANSKGIGQKDVQTLLWAIIAKADFTNMPLRMKAVAAALLTPEQLVKLNGGAVKTVTNFATDKGFLEKPEIIRKIEQAQQEIRSLWNRGDFTYEQLENLALQAGVVNEADPFPSDMWFKHSNGYFVRYQPEGYPRTTTQIYVPQGVSTEFVATGTVATPTDSRQRLAQTDVFVEDYEKRAHNEN